jgi:hypothetical protein
MKRNLGFLALIVVPAATVFVACAERAAPASGEPTPKTPPVTRPAGDDQQWGTIKGRVVWAGDAIPKPEVIDTSKEPRCKAKDGGPVTREEWVVNPNNKGIRYVCIWLRTEEDKGKLPVHPDLAKIADADKEVVVDQPCCMFQPHGLALREGQVLVAKNSAEFGHNVDWKGIKQVGGNTLVPPGGKLVIDKMKVTGFPIEISCGIHPWMKGWIWMFDHPYFTVTDADGNFEIKNAPVGKFRIVAWHETGWRNQDTGKKGDPIEIKPGVNDLGTLEMKPRKN